MRQEFSLSRLLKRLFSASGRIGRREYIFTNLGVILGLIAFGMPFALWFDYEVNIRASGAPLTETEIALQIGLEWLAAIVMPFILLMPVISFIATVKRLRDIHASLLWLFLFFFSCGLIMVLVLCVIKGKCGPDGRPLPREEEKKARRAKGDFL